MQSDIEELRLERLKRRWTQYDLAAKSGLRPDKISLFENLKVEPREDELERWRSALGMNANGKHPTK